MRKHQRMTDEQRLKHSQCLKGRSLSYKSEATKANALANLNMNGTPTHGMSKTPVYISWSNMKARCDNPNNPSYKDYGARGIGYPHSWTTFEGFYKDIGHLWEDGLTLERRDVNGNYCKDNCTWESRKTQAINRRNTRLIEFDGKAMTLTDWATYLGKKRRTLAQRFYVYKWSVQDTLLR
jgi:hypothetical protein